MSLAALGAAVARRPVVPPSRLRDALEAVSKRLGSEAVERNLRALDAGFAQAAPARR